MSVVTPADSGGVRAHTGDAQPGSDEQIVHNEGVNNNTENGDIRSGENSERDQNGVPGGAKPGPSNVWDDVNRVKNFSQRNTRAVSHCFPRVTGKNAISITPRKDISAEIYCRAVTRVIPPEDILACGRMAGSILIYLKRELLVPVICSSGIIVDGELTEVMPLVRPSKKVILSNVRPDVPNDLLKTELERFGTVVADIKPVSANFSAELRGVMSFRRFTYMILKDNDSDLDDSFTIYNNGKPFRIFV